MIEYVDLNNAAALDEFVWQHKNCHFMQTSHWGNVKTDWIWHMKSNARSKSNAGNIKPPS